MDFEVAVIGAGVMGSSAAHYLAQEGRRTVLIDQFPLPHSRGSSGGHSRITRQANYGVPALTPIMLESNKEWHRLEKQTGVTLFKPSPLLSVGPGDYSPTADLLRKMEASIIRSGFEPQILPIDQVNKIYRTSFPPNYKAVIDPSAGVLLADKCVQIFRNLFIKNGGQILDGWPITSITPGELIEIEGAEGKKIKVKSVVICPGSWFGPLMATLGIKVPIWVEKIGVYYWKIKDPETPNFTFIDCSEGENHFYALPDIEYPGYMKAGDGVRYTGLCPHIGPAIDPTERDKTDLTDDRLVAQRYVAKNFSCLESTPSVIEACMYTVTADHAFILDRHPQHKNIVFAGGFSGTGFKIAPSCGEALARMAMGLEPKLDFSSFGCQRFDQQVKSRL